MNNSFSSDKEWSAKIASHLTVMANNNDLSSREVERYTNKLTENASKEELAIIIKSLLNHIRIQK